MNATSDTLKRHDAWYRQPIAWLAMAVFAALLAGCAWTVAISLRYTDTPTHGSVPTILGVPAPTVGTGAHTP
jgi:hypothetical protein